MDIYTICKNGDLPKLKQLCDSLKLTKDCKQLYKPDFQGLLPLDLTVINDKFECCKYLFETYGLNPLVINGSGTTALAYSIDLNRLLFLKFFIDNSKSYLPNKSKQDLLTFVSFNGSNQSALEVAIESAHPQSEKPLQVLLNYINVSYQLRKSLFIGAVRICNSVLIECILKFGNPNEEEFRELVNLHFSAARDYMKKTILADAETTPLIYSINRKDRQLINYFLSQPFIDVNLLNVPLLDKSPLFVAIEQNDLETVELLIEKKVNKVFAVKGILPIQLAINMRVQYLNDTESKLAKDNFAIIECLSTNPYEVHVLNDAGFCPFDIAVMLEMTDVIAHFCSIQADLYERKNRIGKAPIDNAEPEYRKFLCEKFPPIWSQNS